MSQRVIDRVWGPKGLRLLLGDSAVIALLVTGVVALAVPGATGIAAGTAEVQAGGRPAASLDLSRDAVTEVAGSLGPARIEVRGGRVRVLGSPCPRQHCRHGGWIGSPGEVLVCVPNQVVIRLAGRPFGAADAVAR